MNLKEQIEKYQPFDETEERIKNKGVSIKLD